MICGRDASITGSTLLPRWNGAWEAPVMSDLLSCFVALPHSRVRGLRTLTKVMGAYVITRRFAAARALAMSDVTDTANSGAASSRPKGPWHD